MDSNKLPRDAEIRKEMEKMVRLVDIENTTTKQFIKQLSDQMGVDLKPKKDFIKDNLTAVLDELESDEEEEIDEESNDDDDSEASVARSEMRRSGKGILAVKELSPEMAAFMGTPEAARTDVVKQLWAHIKKAGLQNPSNKQEIILDKRLKQLFHVDKVTMFSLNKYVAAHVHPFRPVNLDERSHYAVKRKAESKATKKTKDGSKKRRAGTQPPWLLSENLAAVVGQEILPRPQVIQKLWVYIKEHNLQVSRGLSTDKIGHLSVTHICSVLC
jgi:upstream activation factor subunit UAF30